MRYYSTTMKDNSPVLASVREVARTLGLGASTVRKFCSLGRISGAQLVGQSWTIPVDPQTRRPRIAEDYQPGTRGPRPKWPLTEGEV